MKHVWTILQREYRERVRRRSFIIGTILGPLLMIGLMVVPIIISESTVQRTLRVSVVDDTESLFPLLQEVMGDTLGNGEPRYVLEEVFAEEDFPDTLSPSLVQDLEEERTDICLIIPADVFEGGEAQLHSKKVSDWDIMQEIQARLTNTVTRVRLEEQGFDPDRIANLTSPISIKTFKLERGEAREEGFISDFLQGWLFVMILYGTLIFYGQAIQRGIIEDKGSRIVEVLLSTTTPIRMMWGKILGVGLVGITQYAIWGLFGVALATWASSQGGMFGEVARQLSFSTFLYFVLFFVLGYFVYSCLFAAIGSMVSSDQDAQQLQMPVIILIIAALMLSFAIPKDPSGSLATVGSMVPFFAPIMMFMRINIYTPPTYEILLSVVIMLATIAFLVYLTARIFRVGILMYGKRPTLPEVMRWIRQG
jgi:ABC-2 type transport system permease protein